MKQFVIFITLFMFLVPVISSAQSTFDNPIRGQTHEYNANVTGGSGLTTRWYVASDVAGTKATEGTDYTITAGSGAFDSGANAWVGTGVYVVNITWGTGLTVGDNYYVFLEVDASNGCTNRMAQKVTIAAYFKALAYNVTGSSDPFAAAEGDGDIVASECPTPIVNPIWDGTGHTDIGTTVVTFKVERRWSLLAWQFEYDLNDNLAVLAGINNIRIVNESNVELYNGTSSAGIVSLAANQNFALVYVTMQNKQGAAINIDFDLIIANGNTKDAGGNLCPDAANAIYTIESIPAITNFGGN